MKWILLSSLHKEHNPADTLLDFGARRPTGIVDTQNCKVINCVALSH